MLSPYSLLWLHISIYNKHIFRLIIMTVDSKLRNIVWGQLYWWSGQEEDQDHGSGRPEDILMILCRYLHNIWNKETCHWWTRITGWWSTAAASDTKSTRRAASCRFEIILPPSQVFQQKCEMFWFLRPSVNESSYNCNHLSVSLTTKSVLLCRNF